MAQIWMGNEVAAHLTKDLRRRAEDLRRRGTEPTLAALRVGEDPAAEDYAASIRRQAERVGITVTESGLPQNAAEEDVLAAIRRLNGDAAVHGILLFLPLPEALRPAEKRLCAAIAPEKDVDGVTPLSAAGTYLAEDRGFTPCTAEACMLLLEHHGADCTGKRAVVVGRSPVVGRPAAMLLMHKNATVTVCHTRTKDLSSVTAEADLLLSAAGCAGLIGKEHVKPGAIVLDVGSNWLEETGKLVGDVRFDEVCAVAGAVTPVPGGVGSVTTAVLLSHVIRSAERTAGR